MFRLYVTGDLGFEFWMDIPGYEGLYQASTYGRVRSFKWGHPFVLKPRVYKTGYNTAVLYKERVPKVWMVHQLVARAFLPNPENKPFVDHFDTDKLNCRVENLRWVTSRENSRNPNTLQHIRESHAGKPHPQKKGTRTFVYTKDGKFLGVYKNMKEASVALGCNENTVLYAMKNGTVTLGKYRVYRDRVNPSD